MQYARLTTTRGIAQNIRYRVQNVVSDCWCLNAPGYLEHIHRPGNTLVAVHCVDLDAITEQGQYIRDDITAERTRQINMTALIGI